MRTFKLPGPIAFDNDCLASFLWVKKPDLLVRLFGGKILVPDQVWNELSHLNGTSYRWVFQLLKHQIDSGNYHLFQIPAIGQIAAEYFSLIKGARGKALGSGEAAVLAYVRFSGGTVASNNLRDVLDYCNRYGLELISTDDILCIAVTKGILVEGECENLWQEMKARHRKLPPYNFAEALRRFRLNLPK